MSIVKIIGISTAMALALSVWFTIAAAVFSAVSDAVTTPSSTPTPWISSTSTFVPLPTFTPGPSPTPDPLIRYIPKPSGARMKIKANTSYTEITLESPIGEKIAMSTAYAIIRKTSTAIPNNDNKPRINDVNEIFAFSDIFEKLVADNRTATAIAKGE